jgi:hypothetical protein
MYATIDEVADRSALFAEQFPDLATVTDLPETTANGRAMQLIRIAAGPKGPKHTLYIQAGIHAREWGTVDIVLHFVERLLASLRDATDIVFGNKTFAAADVRAAAERVDVLIVPCVNPDGRAFSMEAGNDEAGITKTLWRRNRRDNGNPQCFGVDLNRNFDWLWDFRTALAAAVVASDTPHCQGGFPVSDDVCDPGHTYHGPSPFSEPETRNVRSVLSADPHVRVFVDVHGVYGKLMTPWADDDVQTTDPEQNFLNPAFDGVRGLKDTVLTGGVCQGATPDPNGPAYKEFMHAVDQSRYGIFSALQCDAVAAVRGTPYVTGTSFVEMYGMTGNANDYAYSRHLLDPGAAKTDGYIWEVQDIGGLGFQPPFEEPPGATDMIHVIRDVAAGLTALLLNVDRIPFVEVSPARLGFGRVRVGTSSNKGIAVINRGIRPVDVGPVATLGTAGPFTVQSVSPAHLAPGEMAVVTVRATPTAAGDASTRVAIEFAYENETVRDVRIVPCTVRGCTVAHGACAAPTFAPTQSSLVCLLRAIVYAVIIAALAIFAWIPSVNCAIRQYVFRIRRCRDGNNDPCRTL